MKTNETRVTGDSFATGPANRQPSYTGMTQDEWNRQAGGAVGMDAETLADLERMLDE